MRTPILGSLLAAAVLLAVPGFTFAAQPEFTPVLKRRPVADADARLIVKFRADDRVQIQSAGQPRVNPAEALARRASLNVKRSQDIGGRMRFMQVDTGATGESVEQLMARLRLDPQVEYVQRDRRRYINQIPNDPLYVNQWYLKGTEASAIRAESAWDFTSGGTNVVVAFLDTGVLFSHPDLGRVAQGGRLLPGYDFASEPDNNDGDGWDADPSDPGDWGCELGDTSSWHGTRVAGLIGARTNNSDGIAGVTWNMQLLPVRVLGRCGGFDHDIIAGLRWAAGIHVDGVPDNTSPAKVINMSLGSDGQCTAAYIDVFQELNDRGVLVVVSAGNDVGHQVSEPANCPGVLAVAGLRHAGSKVGYSNIGPEVGISAPAGNCVNLSGACLNSLQTTTNLGATSPSTNSYTDQFNINVGTSFSSPIVAGVAALLRSQNTTLTPAQTIIRLQKTARAFPTVPDVAACQVPTATSFDQLECNCTTGTCGAGMLDAGAAIAAAQLPFVIVSATPTTPASGQTVSLNGASSFASNGRTVTGYTWTVVSSTGTAPVISNATSANASFVANSANPITLRLTVTDSQGAQNSEDVTVNPQAAPPPPPPTQPSGGGGGGGGGFLLLELLFLALLAALRMGYPARRAD